MGIAAHALDELNGRPLNTRIPDAVLWALAAIGLGRRRRARHRWRARGLTVDLGVHRGRRVPGARLQPRAVRRVGALRSVVRSGVGGLPRPHGVLRADGAHRTGGDRAGRPRARASLRRNGSCRRLSDGSDARSRRSRGRSRRATATSSRSTPARSDPRRSGRSDGCRSPCRCSRSRCCCRGCRASPRRSSSSRPLRSIDRRDGGRAPHTRSRTASATTATSRWKLPRA